MMKAGDAKKALITGNDDDELHAAPVGVKVYASEPLGCVIISVSVSDEQVWLRVPPLPTVEVDKASGEINVNVPPVLLERVIATLVAFTVSASATDPVAMVRVMAGDVRDIFVAFE